MIKANIETEVSPIVGTENTYLTPTNSYLYAKILYSKENMTSKKTPISYFVFNTIFKITWVHGLGIEPFPSEGAVVAI